MRRFLAAMLVLGALLAAPAATAQPARSANVEAQFHAARAAIAPGERFTIVLRQSIAEGWHTYWRNPGDSGEPTQIIAWRLPAGFEAGPIQWPAPEALPFDILVNYGYSNEVLLPIEITAPATARIGETVTLTAEIYWLECADICIPGRATLNLALPVEASGRDDPQWAARVAEAVAALPRRTAGVEARISRGAPARLSVTLPSTENIRNARFFPFDRAVMRPGEAQRPRVGPNGVSFSLTPGVADNLGQAPLEGVVVYEAREDGRWLRRGFEIAAQPGAALAGTDARAMTISSDYALAELEGGAPAAPAQPLGALGLAIAVAFAFLGGLILNVMPCVLPVLSVKALSLASGVQTGAARRHGALYFVGVMATFMALAFALLALRSAGEAAGWGFQLQAPWMTSALALLFFAIGLNLLGVFEIGGSLQNAGGDLAGRRGDAGAFFTGVLAVIAATPCTAPFMAGAIGVAVTQSALTMLLIFAALGLGFALPLAALHFAPGLQRLIPKPGPWMERAKAVLAFPMFAAAVWLAWVLAEQAGPMGVLALLSVAAALAFALFVGRWSRVWLAIGLAVLATTAALTWRPLAGVQTQAVLASEAWSPDRVNALRAEGRGVFVNFTAAWCVTCKVNELGALSSARVAAAFERANVAYLKADWTNRDDTIAAALADHGRAGVPLYLYYPPGGDAEILPQVLTEALILEMIEGDTP